MLLTSHVTCLIFYLFSIKPIPLPLPYNYSNNSIPYYLSSSSFHSSLSVASKYYHLWLQLILLHIIPHFSSLHVQNWALHANFPAESENCMQHRSCYRWENLTFKNLHTIRNPCILIKVYLSIPLSGRSKLVRRRLISLIFSLELLTVQYPLQCLQFLQKLGNTFFIFVGWNWKCEEQFIWSKIMEERYIGVGHISCKLYLHSSTLKNTHTCRHPTE